MRKVKNVGYIVVVQKYPGVAGLSAHIKEKPEKDILWFGTPATLFKTKNQAQRAINKTLEYRAEMLKNHPNYWPWWEGGYHIQRVTANV